MELPALPIAAALPELKAALASGSAAVLEAPPGAGKSTVVPLALLDEPWLAGTRILMLQPRRLAARAVAGRMASLLGESVGETVGYRTRLDTRVGPRTRIEVLTEGILTRALQRDPELPGTGLVIFDEFHERSLAADLGLALVLDSRRHLRPALKVLVMSATLDGAGVAALLGGAPRISAQGLSFPVTTRYAERTGTATLEAQAASAVRRALATDPGDLLVFLPGAAEIRRVERLLNDGEALPAIGGPVRVLPLYGDLSKEAQDAAISLSPAGQRKVVLATNIAETSLTIEGVRVVIDSGLERRTAFHAPSGMARLQTGPISAASADQRRGRAGRLAPGVCYRLWTEAQQRALLPHSPPEMRMADLAPLALELAAWGAPDPAALDWLDPPPAGPLAQARELLHRLGALDPEGRITAHGREMARLGTHPRLAHLLIKARGAGVGYTGCLVAALLGERDILREAPGQRDADLRSRLELLARDAAAGQVDRGALRQVQRVADTLTRQLRVEAGPIAADEAGWLLATAYPDRIGRARAPGDRRYQLSNGRGAFFAEAQSLARSEFLVIPELDAGEREARIFLAAPLTREEIQQHCAEALETIDTVAWDGREKAVRAVRQQRLGALVLSESTLTAPEPGAVRTALLAGLRELGLDALPWTPELRQWQARVALLRSAWPEASLPWPDVSDAQLLATLEDWLPPWLEGMSRHSHLARLDLGAALHSRLDYGQQRQLDELAPTHLAVPSGSRIAIDYLADGLPSVSVRLQEVFGLKATPRIAGNRVPLLFKLLSPARRPVQVTQDLESFWSGAYHEVRRELKGRYPRHYWPEDPRVAEPTRRLRPRR